MTNEAPDRLAQLQVAAETAKKLLIDQSKTMTLLQPKLKRAEYLDRELQREHETVRALIESHAAREDIRDRLQTIDRFQDELTSALLSLVETPGGT